MSFSEIHGYVLGFVLMGSWVVIMLWSLFLRLRKAEEAPTFWRAVSLAQILLGVQLLAGVVLLILGRRPGDGSWGTTLFHVSYGLLSPLVVLFFAHKWARDGRINAYTAFAIVGLVNFGLTFRAFQVATGV